MLTSKNMVIIPFGPENNKNTQNWANDREIQAYILRSLPVTDYDQDQWYAELCRNRGKIVFAVNLTVENKHIGNTGFYHLDLLHRRAEFWLLIGEKQYHGKGYGKEIVQLMLYYGFESLNLNRIYLHVRQDHLHAVKLYEKMGFEMEGVLKEHSFIQGEYINVLTMSILRKDYVSHQLLNSLNK